jgi:hypothetical protein
VIETPETSGLVPANMSAGIRTAHAKGFLQE